MDDAMEASLAVGYVRVAPPAPEEFVPLELEEGERLQAAYLETASPETGQSTGALRSLVVIGIAVVLSGLIALGVAYGLIKLTR
jgi:hypothetical protein